MSVPYIRSTTFDKVILSFLAFRLYDFDFVTGIFDRSNKGFFRSSCGVIRDHTTCAGKSNIVIYITLLFLE